MKTNPACQAKRYARSQAGAALIEFLVVVPLLVLVLLGTIELGRYMYFSIVVANAARAAVQYGSQSAQTALDTTGMTNAAKADGTNSIATLNVSPTDICTCWDGTTATTISCNSDSLSCATGHPVEYVSVTVTGTVNPLFHYPLLPGSHTLSSTAT